MSQLTIMRVIKSSLALSLITMFPAAQCAEVFVDAANTSGVEDGSAEWPFSTIINGLDAAVRGDTVTVAPGVYYGTVTLKDDVRLVSSDGPEVTVIDGEGVNIFAIFAPYEDDPPDIYPDSYIKGFTVRNGGNTLLQVTNRYSFWARSTFGIHDCIFEGDGSNQYQKAHYIYPGARTVVTRSVYRNLGHATDIIWAPTPVFINNTFDNVRSAFFVYQQSVVTINNSFSGSYSVFHLWGGRSGGGSFFGARNNIFDVEQTSVPVLLDSGILLYPVLNLMDGLEADPLFVDPASGDYGLQAGSPLIDAGVDPVDYGTLYPDPSWVGNTVQGIAIAFVGGSPDIGAYEYGVTSVIEAIGQLAESYQAVPAADFKNPAEQRRYALERKFYALLQALENNFDEATDCERIELLSSARDKLIHDIWAKGDGFFGGNPNNDWIVTQEEQGRLYDKVQDTLLAIDQDLASLACN